MKFENPIMNISMFEVENVVTTSQGGGDTPVVTEPKTAAEKAREALNNANATQVLSFTF